MPTETLPYSPTLPNLIRACAQQFRDREFIVEDNGRHTYGDIEGASAELALGLLAAGVGKGTRIGILMGNGADWITAWWAAARAGAFAVPISTFFQARELDWVLRKADIRMLLVQRRVVNADYEALLEKALPGLAAQPSPELHLASHPYLRRIVVWGECTHPWATPGPGGLLELARRDGLDRAFLQQVEEQVTPSDLLVGICTSGSTAEPKIVMHTHGSVVRSTNAFRRYLRVAPDERNYTGMPLFWIGGLNVNLLQVMFEGACNVYARSPRADDVIDTLVRERVTRVNLQPSQQVALIEAAKTRGIDLGFVRSGLFEPRDASGAVIPIGSRSRGNLGMSETFGPHGYWWYDQPLPPERKGSAGSTLEPMERKVVDSQTGKTLPLGEVGELLVRGPHNMAGYYKRERAEVFTPDDFFPTGDLCTLDDAGHVYFQARRSEMIKAAGANVAPAEVEAALMATGGLKEALVFGLPDEVRGEKVVAVIVPNAGVSIDVPALKARLKGDMSVYKVPTDITAVSFEVIPRTAGGKPSKVRLKEMWMSGELAGGGTR